MSPTRRARRTRPVAVALSIVAAVMVLATACSDSEATGAPEIVEGRTECDECHMIVDDTRFAAAYRLSDGTEKRFDDIGDMAAHRIRNGELSDAEVYVFDYYTKDALLAGDATFVVGADISTPMASGVLALADEADAADLVGDGTTIVDWDELQQIAAEGGLEAETGRE